MTLPKIDKRLIIIMILSICSLLPPAIRPCHAETTTANKVVLEMGDSRIYTDVLAARSAAVSRCLMNAVEETAIGMIPFATLSDRFETVTDLLSSQRNQFITDYKVLKEISTEKYYRVLVQVTVSTTKLEEALAGSDIVLSPENLPKILFLITEQQADDISPQYWWRQEKSIFRADVAVSAIKKIFTEKQFSVIDDELIPFGIYEDMNLNADITNEQALELGKRVNADIVVVGKANATEMSNRMGENVLTFKATVTARGLVVATGEQIVETSQSKTNVNRDIAAGSNQALADAGNQAGIALASQILTKWHERMEKAGEITMTVKGTDILPYLVAFRNKLKNIDGIESQQTQEMTPDEAILSIKYNGSSKELADALLLKTFDGFGIDIYELTANIINIKLVAK